MSDPLRVGWNFALVILMGLVFALLEFRWGRLTQAASSVVSPNPPRADRPAVEGMPRFRHNEGQTLRFGPGVILWMNRHSGDPKRSGAPT
jgi:hypothetical protein